MEKYLGKKAKIIDSEFIGKITGVAKYDSGEEMVLVEGTKFENWLDIDNVKIYEG